MTLHSFVFALGVVSCQQIRTVLMGKKFHVAMFCADEAFAERRTFYTATFGAASYEGAINEGSDGHSFKGCIWEKKGGLIFALLRKPGLIGPNEQLAHIGFIFDSGAEFDAEIRRRGIDPARISVLQGGERQVFVRTEIDASVEWEFSCSTAQASERD